MLKNGCHLEMSCCWEHFHVKCLMETGCANFHANITNLPLISLKGPVQSKAMFISIDQLPKIIEFDAIVVDL